MSAPPAPTCCRVCGAAVGSAPISGRRFLLALLALGALLGAPEVHGAQLEGAATTPSLPDSSRPAQIVPDTAAVDSARLPSPRGALLRSGLLPGWGQLYNHRPAKAVLCAATSAGLLAAALSGQAALHDATTAQQHQDRAARRNTRLLLWAVSVTLAAVDAYVDAQLATFPADGAAPVGAAPAERGMLLCVALPLPGLR